MIESIVDQCSFFWELYLMSGLFAFVFRRRSKFVLRAIAVFAGGILLSFLLPTTPTLSEQISSFFRLLLGILYPRYLILFVYTLFGVWFALDCSLWEAMFAVSAAYCMQHIIYKLYSGLNDLLALLIRDAAVLHSMYASFRFVISYVCMALFWFLFVRKLKRLGGFRINSKYMILLSVAAVTAANILNGIFYVVYLLLSPEELKPLLLIVYFTFPMLLCLLCLFGLLDGTYRETLSENFIKSQALYEKLREQYQTSKRHADTINIKYHDLKRFLENSLFSADAAADIRQAVKQYESLPKTQNNALNIVLAEKLPEMETQRIEFRSNIYAEPLSMLSGTDVYAFFSNLLSNSIEYLKSNPTEERYIALDIQRSGDMLKIRAENPLSGTVTVDRETGLPETTKRDKENHGFGVQSMRQVMQKYGGNLVFDTRGGRFTVIALLPIR